MAKKVHLLNANRKSIMAFSTSHQSTSYVTLNFPKWGLDTQICRFSQKSRPETTISLLQSFIVQKLPAAKL